ncbi:MAG: AsmA family protein [Candidatus Omnitrophica bacterium]|nr:AsmA family protein [Candidatus Omnitrophota bacterium]
MKKLIIISALLVLAVVSVLAFLNFFLLPKKIRPLIITTITRQTNKDVRLGSLSFNIFKGLIVRDLVISDGKNTILSAEEASCGIFVWPVFKRKIIIPSINLKNPYIFLARLKDGKFNLQEIFASRPAVVNVPAGGKSRPGNSEFSVSVFKINIDSGNIVFQDDTLEVPFRKEIRNIRLGLGLALPGSVKFNFKGEIADEPPAVIYGRGEYRFLEKEMNASLSVSNLALKGFEPYYGNRGVDILSGAADGKAKFGLKDGILHIELSIGSNRLVLAKEKIRANLDLVLETKADYNLQTKKVSFEGSCEIKDADITGLDYFGDLKNFYGKVIFNERSLLAQGLKAEILGVPFEVSLGIKDFSTLAFNISTSLSLGFLPDIAKEKFNFTQVSSASGKADLSVKLHPDGKGGWSLQGKVDVAQAGFKLAKQDVQLENIFACVEFSRQGLRWEGAKFRYRGVDYESSGELNDFSAPSLQAQLSSRGLSLSVTLNAAGKKINIAQLKGRYLDSQFCVSGDIDNSEPAGPKAEISGYAGVKLEDLGKFLSEKHPEINKTQIKGQVDAQILLKGPLYDFKSCFLQAKVSSDRISCYGFSMEDFNLDYLQEDKRVRVAPVNAVFYDGTVEGSALLNLSQDDLPYHVELQAKGVKLEKLKLDTASRDKNIYGKFQADVKLDGFCGDLNKLSGAGDFSVKEGKLWEMDLLKKMGKLLFSKDTASIELSECSCAFLVQNRSVYTDKLELRGNVIRLCGPLKVGFDGSLDGALEVNILSEVVPLNRTLKDIAAAIVGKVGKFGVITFSGSLAEPKYNFKPIVVNIVKGLTDIIFGRQRKDQ